jgi:DNA helicase-2/ATP-dependent DNA helicase PcrA
MCITEINSSFIVPAQDLDKPFKVEAGAGSGKTYWLINHIKNVSKLSTRLGKSRKILCITYTNNAVATIKNRLGSEITDVEIMTIHSFLYHHVVRPYCYLIAAEYGVNIQDLEGHDDRVLGYSSITEWLNLTNQTRTLRDRNDLINALKSLRWKYVDGSLTLKNSYYLKYLKTNSLFEYKKLAWQKGYIHHDDLLFFTYKILEKIPFIATVIAAKFPYIFIDEFQDCNPIQVHAVKKFAEKAIIGIIGDKAQSIYGFAGAEPKEFENFQLPNLQYYQMKENRRSSNEIIDLLNHIRPSFPQNKFKNESSSKPIIIVGQPLDAYNKVCELIKASSIKTLAYQNITTSSLREQLNPDTTQNLMHLLESFDNNQERLRLIKTSIEAIALADSKNYKEALRKLSKLKLIRSDEDPRKLSLTWLAQLTNYYHLNQNSTLKDFAQFIKENLFFNLTKVTKGGVKNFYESNNIKAIMLWCSVEEDFREHITIHKAKGDEFESVLFVLENEKNLDFLLNPNLDSEPQRVSYVAVSRPKKNLFINTPTLSEENQQSLPLDLIEVLTI